MRRSATVSLVAIIILSLAAFVNAQTLAPSPTGSWTLTGAMSQARTGAAAAAMSDGRVLVTGGTDSSGNIYATAEIFGPSGTFTATTVPSMNFTRTGHTATWLPNPSGSGGYVLVTGGTTTGGAILASAELYDPSQNTWTLIAAPMIDALTGEPATALISTSSTPNTSVLLSGGTTSAAGATPPTAATADVEVFNLTNLSTLPFTFVGALPTARTNHVAAALQDGRVFIAGGTDANGNTLNTTAIYDPVAGTVSQGPNLNTPRANATATTLLDGTVLIAGGSYPEGAAANNNIAELNTAEIFNPAGNGTITPAAANLVQARAGQQAFLLPNNNNVLLVGGTYNGATLASSELYSPWQTTFTATGTMLTPRSSATGAALFPLVDGQLLVSGGSNSQPSGQPGVANTVTVANSAELYGFATVETDASDYAPGTPVVVTGTGWQASEWVSLSVNSTTSGADTPPVVTTQATTAGEIADSFWAPDNTDLGARFYLKATGVSSGLQAQNTFTDAASTTISGTVKNGSTCIAGATITAYTDSTLTTLESGTTNPATSASTCSGTPSANWTLTLSKDKNNVYVVMTTPAGYAASTFTGGTGTTEVSDTEFSFSNSSSGVSITGNAFTLVPAPTQLAITSISPSSPTAGVAFSVTVVSQNGSGTATNVTTNTLVTLTLAAGSGTLGGTLTGTIDSGQSSVTISGVTYTKAQTGVELTATASGGNTMTAATSSAFTVAPGTPTKLIFTTEPTGSTGGVALGTQPVVTIEDADGNTVTSSTDSIQLAITNGTGTSGAALTCTSANPLPAISGVATFTGCNINKSGTAYTLTASYSGLTSAISTPSFNITVGPATQLAFTTEPNGGVAATTWNPQPVVAVEDAGGNTVTSGTGSTASIGLTISGGTAGAVLSCNPLTSKTATSGVATFVGCSINESSANTYTLTAASGGYTSATSTFTITARTTTTAVVLTPSSVGVGAASSATVTVTDGGTGTQSNPAGTVALGSSDLSDSIIGTPCTLSNSGANAATCTMTITPSEIGTSPHTLTATYTPTDNVHATSNGTAPLTVTMGTQTNAVTLTAPTTATYGQTGLSASASGGNGTGAYSYSAGTSTACSVGASTGVLTISSGSGSCSITATRNADGNYNVSAASSPASITVSPATQTTAVTVTAPTTATYGQTGLSASASGGNSSGAYSYSAGSSTACSVGASTGALTISSGTGSCSITATRAADANYNVSAASSPATVTVSPATQTTAVTLTAPTTATYGQTGLSASASGGNGTGGYSYSAGSSTACSVGASTGALTISSGTGSCSITATRNADANYNVSAASSPATITVSPATQTTAVTVTAPTTATYGQTGLSASASGGNGTGGYSYSAGSSTACSVGASTGALTISSGSGSCSITATRAADANYNVSAASSPATITVSPATQTTAVTVTAPTTATYGQTGLTASASGGNGTGGYSYSAGSSTACSVGASTGALTISSGSGSCSITATRNADANYNVSAASSPATVTVSPATQTTAVTVTAPTTATYGQTGLSASASGGNGTGGYSYSAGSSTACSVGASTGALTISSGSGSCSITATRAADANYNVSAASSPATITVSPATQTTAVTVTAPTTATYGQAGLSVGASGGNGTGGYSYSAGSSTACSVDSSTGALTISSGSGSCSITATRAADGNYNASAASNPATVTVSPATQTTAVTVTAPTTATYGQAGLSVGASGGNGTGGYSYSAGSSTACSVGASSGALTISSGSGSCSITATRNADGNYNASAASTPATVTVSPATQTTAVTVTAPTTAKYGQAGLSASASGGNSSGGYSYSAGSSTACSVDGSTGALTISSGSGSCSITATRNADGNYNVSAASSPATVTVSPVSQTTAVTVTAPTTATYGQTGLSASASGGNGSGAYSYSAGSSTACSVGSSTGALTISSGTGSCSITATRNADGNYNASAATSPATVTVSPASQTTAVTVTAPTTATYGQAGLSAMASGGNGSGAYSYSAGSSTACSVGSSTGALTISSGTGSCSITATHNADGNYNASAASSPATVTVSPATPTLSWTAPAAISYGTALSTTQLNATSGGVAGAYVYTPAAGKVLAAGSQKLSVTFTPNDTTDYNTASATVSLTVVVQGVDLIESAVSGPASAGAGGTIQVVDTATNAGNQTAAASLTGFYLSIDGTTRNMYLGNRSVGALAPGVSSAPVTTTLTLPTSLNGTYYVIACANYNNGITETNTANNCAASTSFSLAGAELVESAVSVLTSAPVSGGSLQVSDTVTDQGVGNAGASLTGFYLSVDGIARNTYIGNRSVGALAAGGNTGAVTTTLTLPINLNGSYYLLACANYNNALVESSTAINCTASVKFSVAPADLAETAVSVLTSAPASGVSLQVTDTLQNQGAGNAGASLTGFYLSVDGIARNTYIGNRSAGALSAGGSTGAVTTTLTLPINLNGTYYLLACADYTNQVAEANKANNCSASAKFTVAGADLVESAVSILTTTPTLGGSLQISDTVLDQGLGSAGASSTGFYLSVNGTTRNIYLGNRSIGALNTTGTSGPVTTTLTLPASTSAGTYYVVACANYNNGIVESSTANNCTASANTMLVP